MGKKGTIAAFVGGAIGGAALGLLFAPKTGKEMRKDLCDALDNLAKKAKDIDSKEIKKYVDKNIKKIKKELDELSVEKVLDIAKKKAKDIEKSVSDLVTYVKGVGTPVLEGAVDQVRLKSIDVINGVINKLEEPKSEKKKNTTKEDK